MANVTHEDVKSTSICACQILNLDLVNNLLDNNVAMLGVLYFIIAYFFPRDHKKVVYHLFVFVHDFSTMDRFSWGKLLIETTLSRNISHYGLRGMSIAFQALIYEIIPSLDGIMVARVSMTHPDIKN